MKCLITAVGRLALVTAAMLPMALVAGCTGSAATRGAVLENVGVLGFQLVLSQGDHIDVVSYTITGPGGFTQTGTIDVSNSSIVTGVFGGIPAGTGYTITLTASAADGGTTTCVGSAMFDVTAGTTVTVPITLHCKRPATKGSVLINGAINECPNIDTLQVLPAKAGEDGTMSLTSTASDGDHGPLPLSYAWTATSGTLNGASSPNAIFTCTAVGTPTITLEVSDGDPEPSCADKTSFQVICVACLGEGTTCNDHNVCTLTDTCHSEACIGTNPAPARTPCAPAHICDGAGACVECLGPSDCPGSDTACATRTCTAGVCGVSFAPAGPAPMQTPGDCVSSQCDGAGHTMSIADNSDVPVDGKACTGDVCTSGVPSNPALAYGTSCTENGGQICNGSGACVPITFKVVRVGDGSATLTATAAPVFIEERKLDGSLAGPTIAMPTAANGSNRPFVTTGQSLTEAALSRSADERYLTLSGYGVVPGTADPASASTAPRIVARVSATAQVDTSTVLTTGAFVSQNVRTAVSVDGSSFWVGGVGAPVGGVSTGGIWYTSLGATSGGTQINSSPIRVLGINGGQLFGTGDSSVALEVFRVGSGLPTSSTPVVTSLPGMPTTGTSPWAFVFFDLDPSSGDPAIGGLDTVYVVNASGTPGIERWKFNNGTSLWSLVKTMNVSPPAAFRGLAGVATSTGVALMASTAGMANNRLVVFVDDGSPSPAGATVATGTSSMVFRGIAPPPHN